MTTLLIVDDNKGLCSAYALMFEGLGYQVLLASNGEQAINLCLNQSGEAPVAIVDLKMPGLDGPSTIAALKAQAPELKVISISGENLGPYFRRLADLGVRHFVKKPFSIAELMETIQEVQTAA